MIHSLQEKHLGKYRNEKARKRYVRLFVRQFASSNKWNCEKRMEEMFEYGSELRIPTDQTEYGCGIHLNRPYDCWCRHPMKKNNKIQKLLEMKKAEIQRRIQSNLKYKIQQLKNRKKDIE